MGDDCGADSGTREEIVVTLTIEIAPEEEAALRQKAASLGEHTEAVAAALLKQVLQADAANKDTLSSPMTEAEFNAYWGPYIGIIHGSREALS